MHRRPAVIPWARGVLVFATLLALAAPFTAWAVTVPANFVVENAVPGATFDTPTAIAFLPDGRMLVAEKQGAVWVVQNGTKLATPFWIRPREILNQGDRGLLDLAVDPNFASNRYVYFLYTVDPDSNGSDNNDDAFGRLARYQVSISNPNVVDTTTRAILFGRTWTEGPASGSVTHTIGSLRWGTDGSLIVSAGEGAQFQSRDVGGRDPNMFGAGKTDPYEDIGAFRAQYIGSLAGKILRINPLTGLGYPSNPFYDGNAGSVQSRVWAYGLRNPFRICVRPGSGASDPAVGDPGSIYVGDVGWDYWEELSVATQGGRNFGWPCYEGTHAATDYQNATPAHHGCSTIGTSANPSPHTPPISDWNHFDQTVSSPAGIQGNAASGVVFYTGTSYPALYQGALFYEDYGQNWIRALKMDSNDNPVQFLPFGTNMEAPVDLMTDPASGDLLYVSITAGQVRRIRYVGPANGAPTAVIGAAPTSGAPPLTVNFSSTGSTDPNSDPLSFTWDFGDGSGSFAANPSHVYPNTGNFTVTLTVGDGHGGTDSKQVSIVVGSISNFPSTPVLDNFNRANGGVGANWSDPNYGINNVAINNNALVQINSPPYSAPVWNVTNFGSQQEAYVTLVAVTGGAPEHDVNLKLQYASYSAPHIEVRYDATVSAVQVATFDDAASPTWVNRGAPIPVTFGPGDQLGARAYSNGTVEVYKNGGLIGTRSVTGWVYAGAGGYIGLALDDAFVSRLDNFGGGNYVPVVNTKPTAVIASPVGGSFYVEGQPVTLSGDGVDNQQTASTLFYHWDVTLHHNNHIHPGILISNLRNDVLIPEDHEDGTGTYLEVKLIVTDNGGLSDTTSTNIYPEVDLEPSAITVTPDPARRVDVNAFAFKIYNHGRMLTRRTHWELLASTTLLAEGDTLLAPLDSLAMYLPLDTYLPAGNYNLRAVVDTFNVEVETNETNNAKTRSLTVVVGPVGVDPTTGPLELSRVTPNPTTGKTTLFLQLPRPARVAFTIHDIQGREVWASPIHDLGAGRWPLVWEAQGMRAGVYLARVQVDGKAWVRRIAVLR